MAKYELQDEKYKQVPLTVARLIELLRDLPPEAAIITERSLSDRKPARVVPQDSGTVLIY